MLLLLLFPLIRSSLFVSYMYISIVQEKKPINPLDPTDKFYKKNKLFLASLYAFPPTFYVR